MIKNDTNSPTILSRCSESLLYNLGIGELGKIKPGKSKYRKKRLSGINDKEKKNRRNRKRKPSKDCVHGKGIILDRTHT